MHRTERAAEDPRGLLVGLAFQVTQNQGDAPGGRQPIEFLVQQGAQFRPGEGVACVGWRWRGMLSFAAGAAHRLHTGFVGDAERHAVQPAAHRFPVADRRGLAGQNQEGGLESVFDIVRLP